MKIFYTTFGCKVNQYETENIRERFEAAGGITVGDPGEAELCVVNTCTVTAEADKKCRQAIHRLRKQNPSCILACMGCMTQAHAGIEKLLPECDIILGSANKSSLPEAVERFLLTRQPVVRIGDASLLEQMSNSGSFDKTRAYIKIQDGCDMSCTYCIIPRARGHIRSKPVAETVSEARKLIASGHRELILTGINLCCTGRERGERLTDTVEAVCGIEGDFRVRLGSMEPELISDEDIARLAALGKLCPQFHLSLQSGCEKTLRAMKRHYTAEDYAGLCERLRKAFPGCAVTTDIMVGFPGETEEDHLESLRFAERIGFAEAHVFQFSRRPDTPAYSMPGQVDAEVKRRRAAEMSEICRRTGEEYLKAQLGRTLRVLFEKETSPEYHQGHSDNYILVRIPRTGPETLRRQFRDVLITGTGDGCCTGELANI